MMKPTGVVRNIDTLGRITIPMEIRKVLGIDERTPLELYITEEGLFLKMYKISCTFCGEHTKETVMGVKICTSCQQKLAEML